MKKSDSETSGDNARAASPSNESDSDGSDSESSHSEESPSEGREAKRPRLTGPDKPAFFPRYTVPLRTNEDDLRLQPDGKYFAHLGFLLAMDPEKEHLHLLHSITQLVQLHGATHDDFANKLNFDGRPSEQIPQIINCLTGDLRPFFQQLIGFKNWGNVIDICNFMLYAPKVKSDIEKLDDPDFKSVLLRLFNSICPSGQHTEGLETGVN